MSVTASRQLVLRLFNNNRKQCIKCLSSVRYKSDHSDKQNKSSKVPDKIEAAVLKKYSEPLHIESIDPPKLKKPTEVLIDVNYCALNGLDVLLCENLYSYEQKLPFVPGYELSGKLLEVSEKAKEAGYNVGDKVVAFNKEKFGGLADQCVADINDIWKIPSSIKSIDAVCLLENYMTALIGLDQYGSIAEEDIVLINVGIGGIGLAAVDIAANVFRAMVIGVGFYEDRGDRIRERGAFQALTYKEKKLLKEIEGAAAERGIKDIFKGETGEHFKMVLNSFMDIYKSKTPSKHLLRDDNFGVVVQHLSREGKLIIAGVHRINDPKQCEKNESKKENKEKEDKEDKKDDKKKEKTFTVTGINLKDFSKRKHDLYRQAGDEVISYFDEGLIKPVPSMIAGFHNVNKAVKFISEMKACGKVIIDMKNKEEEAKPQH